MWAFEKLSFVVPTVFTKAFSVNNLVQFGYSYNIGPYVNPIILLLIVKQSFDFKFLFVTL